MSKVTIQLNSEQRDQILQQTGDEVVGFTWEKLENRDAPKIGGGVSGFIRTGGNPQDAPLSRGGGTMTVNPAS